MTTRQIHLIRTTWQIAERQADVVGPLFYETLFEIAPEVRPLFAGTNVPGQSKKLLSMLSYVIAKLDTLDEIMNEIRKLAKRHVQYGVEDRHYGYVGAALLMTLEKGLGDVWNEEVKDAWTTCYGILSSAMMHAAGATQDAA